VTSQNVIEEKIAAFISQHSVRKALDYLIDLLPDGAVIYLVGGAIRNLIIEVYHGRRLLTDDIDLFIGGLPDDIQVSEIFRDERFIATDLGGLRWTPVGSVYDIDICLLKDFILIKKYELTPHLENLLDTLDFTMNTVVYDIRSRQLYARKALEHIQKQVMVFNTRKLYTKTAIAYRTLLLRYKTNFALAQDVFDFVKQAIDLETLMAVKQILGTRFGKNRMLNILADYDRICSYVNFDNYRHCAPEAITGEV